MPPRLLAVCGTDACGKDYYAGHLAQNYGYMHVSAGDVIRNEARSQGHTDPIPREVLSKVGDDMKRRYGAAPIAQSALEKWQHQQKTYPAGLVISGLRRVPEIRELKDRGGLVVFIDAPLELRFAWQSRRVCREVAATIEAFAASSDIEYYGRTPAGTAGVYLQGVEELADIQFMNGGTEAFAKELDARLGFG